MLFRSKAGYGSVTPVEQLKTIWIIDARSLRILEVKVEEVVRRERSGTIKFSEPSIGTAFAVINGEDNVWFRTRELAESYLIRQNIRLHRLADDIREALDA